MKNLGIYSKVSTAVLGLVISTLFIGCMREEEALPRASFPDVGAIYVDDSFVGLGTNFFFPFVDGGAKPDVFDVDQTEGYVGTSSIRIDVPDADDPGGSFAGATFIIDGYGRNLTQYTALTFWAKASESASIAEFGFGVNDAGSRYQTSATNLRLTTNWKQFIIPIPDPSKLVNEKGMMWFATAGTCPAGDGQCFPENPQGGTKKGFTFWLDEVKFENIGTIGQPKAQIQNGRDDVVAGFAGQQIAVSGVNVSFNMPNGVDLPLNTTSAYFDYEASTPGVVSTTGSNITIVGEGTTTITAKMGDVEASGSLTVQTITKAPEPTRDERIVTSLFSDVYENEPVDFWNGFFEFSTTQGGAIEVAPGDNIINYSDLNFVIAEFKNPTVNASSMTHLHLDVFTFDDTDGASLDIGLGDFGPDNVFGGGNDGQGFFSLEGSGFTSGEWISLDIRLDEFAGLNSRANLAQLIFVSETISNLIVDNVYFYATSPAQDASLASITVDGRPLNGFGSGILNYQFGVPTGSTTVPTIAAVPGNEDAQVSISPATGIPGITTIEVTAPNGVTTQTYTVAFEFAEILGLPLNFESDEITYVFENFGGGVLTRVDNPDPSGINTSGKVAEMVKFAGEPFAGSSLTLPDPIDFSQDKTFRMKVWVPKANVPVLLKVENSGNPAAFFEATATTTVSNAWEELTFDFSGINTSNSYDKFVWIFENGTVGDGSSNFTYYFDDIELFTDFTTDATLSQISVDGSPLAGFNPATLNYDIELPQGTVNVPAVTADANSDQATVAISDATALPGTTTITVTAADGVTTATYTINFTVFSPNADATLSNLQVDGTTIAGFSASTLSYSVELPEGTTAVPDVSATATNSGATVSITDAASLPGTTSVVVTAEDGVTQSTYSINFTVASSEVELITNGGFEAGNDGSWYGNAFNIQTEGGNSYNFANIGAAGNPFDVNMSQLVTLIPGEEYTLTFEASTSPETGSRTMIVGIGQSAAPFFANTEQITLTAENQTFTLTLRAVDDGTGNEFGDATSRVIFDMGAATGVVVIDNVSLVGPGTGGNTPSDPDPDPDPDPTPTELVTNGDFESGSDGSWYGNAFNIQTEGGNSYNFADVGAAGNPFDVNMSQLVTLEAGASYTLTFEASTSPETGSRTMVVGIGQSAAPFFANTEEITLTAENQTFTLTLSAIDDGTGNSFGDATSRVIFDMGADTGVVVIDNVSLMKN